MTDEELKALVASLAIAQKELITAQKETDKKFQETDKQFKETDKKFQETDKQFQETTKQFRETDKKLKELAQQIGGLGNKFGSFTEGMAFPAMQKLLTERFGMEAITTNYKVKRQNKLLELDVFAHANGEINQAFVVEVKSHVREEHIEQLLEQLRHLREFLPEHADKKLYGILAGVHIPEQVKQKVLKEGLYLATIHENNFCLQIPETFQARTF